MNRVGIMIKLSIGINTTNFFNHNYTAFSKKYNLRVIPTGDFIQMLREEAAEFDYPHGGYSLCRDGYHLTFEDIVFKRNLNTLLLRTTAFKHCNSVAVKRKIE